MKMWSTYRKDIILEKLQIICDKKEDVTIWQNRAEEKIKFHGRIVEVNPSNTILELDSSYKKAEYPLTKDLTVFVHYAKGDALFKKEAFKTEGLKLIFKTPVELMMKERRVIERFTFKYQDFKNVSFKTAGAANDQKNVLHRSCILKDLSVEGLGLVIHEEEMLSLSVGDSVYITAITDQKIESGHLGEIRYITPYNVSVEQDSNLFKIGIKFTAALDSVTYRSISSVVEKKQTKMKGINVSTFNGLTELDQEKILRKISEDNVPLANNIKEQIEVIDRLRYLTTGMKQKFLLEVNLDLLAAALRIASKELIFDLMTEVTETMREEFLYKLDQAKPPSAINKAQDEIVKYMRDKERAGELVLDPVAFDTYV
ncbi:hypothetical protein A9Q84_01820 [Halobacteriovorax marinus]|uniref:Flagellar motor switch protein FliG C-terminal domain-containing protein n=1 Tax=Halobacteriovorax marinus TaxID=97084 RepID=A0A1Y5FCN7_9BACT|nr:hypothetical protein A9Q84_01820 [Halobacteriovorax marinus]